MANTNKTKAEILQELESIKGLLLEEDGIPILQELDDQDMGDQDAHIAPPPSAGTAHPSVLPGQTSLFEQLHNDQHQDSTATSAQGDNPTNTPHTKRSHTSDKRHGFAAHLSESRLAPDSQQNANAIRPLAKASGENPFLPQHIRERLHGNNPPPLFEYETAKKIVSATKNMAHKTNKPRQALVDEVIHGLMPQIEAELRHRLFAMSVEDLEKLLNEDEN